jgi:hypothetical protein
MPCIVLHICPPLLHASLGCTTGMQAIILLVNTCSVCLQVEKKIADELREHGLLAVPDQPLPRGPHYADLDKLTYLTCVIKEAMRVHTVRHHSQKSKLNVVTDSCDGCEHPLDNSYHCRSAID